MVYIYFDESGDLGFDFSKGGTSKNFSVAFLIVNEKRPISSLVKKVFASLPQTLKRKSSGVLHAYYEKSSTIAKLLQGISKKDVKIASIRLDKRKVLLIGNPNELYTNIVVTLINRLYTDDIISDTDDIILVASRRNTSKNLNVIFSESVVRRAHGVKFSVNIVPPSDDKCLQAVDFISWAFWQKYEKGDETYTSMIADKIVQEYVMYD